MIEFATPSITDSLQTAIRLEGKLCDVLWALGLDYYYERFGTRSVLAQDKKTILITGTAELVWVWLYCLAGIQYPYPSRYLDTFSD